MSKSVSAVVVVLSEGQENSSVPEDGGVKVRWAGEVMSIMTGREEGG